MKKRKILIYIETPKDVLFAKQYIKSNNQQDEIVVVATSTPARIFAETLNLPYKSYSYITAEINKKNTLPQSYSIINNLALPYKSSPKELMTAYLSIVILKITVETLFYIDIITYMGYYNNTVL